MPTYKIDSTKHFQAIGECVVIFEFVMRELRFSHGGFLQLNGLRSWRLSENLLVIKTISAPDLAAAYNAAVNILSDDSSLKKRAEKIVKDVQDLTEFRNRIVHGEWLISGSMTVTSELPPTDLDQFLGGIKRKLTKRGAEVEDLPSRPDMKKFVQDCGAVISELTDIFRLVMFERQRANIAKSADSEDGAG